MGDDEQKEEFIRAFLYGEKYSNVVDKLKTSGIILQGTNFYDTIKGKTFTESLGVYYQEEIQGEVNTPDANRTKKRVITYTEI